VSVYSQVALMSYVWPATIKLAVPAGTSDGGEIDAPDGRRAESSGGFGQLAALSWGPVGTSIGWGSE